VIVVPRPMIVITPPCQLQISDCRLQIVASESIYDLKLLEVSAGKEICSVSTLMGPPQTWYPSCSIFKMRGSAVVALRVDECEDV
jgi:hypothetical protein